MDIAKQLHDLGLSTTNAVVIGFGILNALDIRQSNDIDVVVDIGTYTKLSFNARFKKAESYGHEILVDGLFEIGTCWGVLGKDQTFHDLFRHSVVLEDVRYISLEFLLEVKQSWLQSAVNIRQKDADDVRSIETYQKQLRAQKFTQKYTIIQLFEEVPEGTQFSSSSWPFHSTVVDTFAIDWGIHTMIKKLEELLAAREQAASTATEDEFFGPEKQTQVVLLDKTDGLVKLRYDIMALLEQGGLKLNNPRFSLEGFLPHSTVQEHVRLNKGDAVTFKALTLVDMFPDEDPYQRKILKTIKIGGAR
jgi:hypothetical protein